MTFESTSNRVELLAPAGGPECLQAAVCAGADAVYLGLDHFNARRNAQNFTLETLSAACDYAHLRGVRIYVTMNIEILPSELENALLVVREAHVAGADAFIVQDIGLARLMRDRLPDVRMHASTQMNIHSAAGIEAAWRLGARRVTLARELSLDEIRMLASVAADFGMEVEAFAHGALCVCYSGQCLMSSMIGGRSANRGLCAQACRLPYELNAESAEGSWNSLPTPGEHLLSPRDLCTAPLLDDLVHAGVASLKIEGRMKSADYVHTVVGVYRAVLDRLMAGDSQTVATPGEIAQLEEAFSRGFTTAYLEHERGNDMMSYGRPNNRGVFIGRVAHAAEGEAEIVPEVPLNTGDLLEFWTNRGHFSAEVGDGRPDGQGRVCIAIDQRASKGDRVFRVRNAAQVFEAEPEQPRVPVSGRIVLRVGQPARFTLSTAGRMPVEHATVEGAVVEAARTKALDVEDVRSHVDRFGQTPFSLVDLDIELDEGVGMGFSQLHHLRAQAAEQLQAALLSPWRERSVGASSVEAISDRATHAARPVSLKSGKPATCRVVAWATNPACARAAKRAGADAVYVPVLNFRRGQATMEGRRQDGPDQAGYPKQCIMALPTVDHDPLYADDGTASTREAALSFDPWDYVREGKLVYADSVASLVRAHAMGAVPEAGIHIPLTNAEALAEAAALGATRAWLSPELTLGQVDDLARVSPIPLGLTVAGFQELMITEHCLLMSQGACGETCETCPRRAVRHMLRDRKDFEFPVVTDLLGRSHLYNGVELDLAAAIPDLMEIGVDAFMVDTTFMSKQQVQAAVSRIARACEAASNGVSVQKRPGTTTGHLFRGVM